MFKGEIWLSEILKRTVEVFHDNAQKSLIDLSNQFDILERKARCCYFVGQTVEKSKDSIATMAPMFEEIFIDLVQSISACLHGQYRLSYLSLRSALELSVAVVYFSDHLVEFKQWKNDDWDFRFSLINEVFSESYSRALGVDSPPAEKQIKKLYHFLSQFVHGKYGYMTVAQDGPILHYEVDKSKEFIDVFTQVFQCIISILSFRFSGFFSDAFKEYPYFKTILKTY